MDKSVLDGWTNRVWRFFFLAAMVFVLLYTGDSQVEGDTLWHIRTGQFILDSHSVPTRDFYSWTAAGTSWVVHEWLWEVLSAVSFGAAGKWGLWLLSGLGIMLYTGALWGVVRQRTTLPVAAVISVLALAASASVWNARPHVLAQGLFAVTVYLVLAARCSGWFWLLPAIELIWVNVHGSAPMGVLFVAGVFFFPLVFKGEHQGIPAVASKERRVLGHALLLMLLASFCNPQGVKSWYYMVFASSNADITKYIGEWFSPNFHSPSLLPALGILTAVLIMPVLKAERGRQPYFEVILVALSCVMWLTSVRHLPYFAMAGALFLATIFGQQELFGRKTITVVLAGLTGAVLLVAGCSLWPPTWIEKPRESVNFPIKAVVYMKERGLTKRVFNHYNWGGYLIWEGIEVFIDGRADMYVNSEKRVFREYIGVVAPEYGKKAKSVVVDPVAVLEEWSVNTVLIPAGSPLDWMLGRDRNWGMVYRDEVAAVHVRR